VDYTQALAGGQVLGGFHNTLVGISVAG